MTGTVEAIEGIAALAIGGFLFIVIGSSLSTSTAAEPIINLQFWGILYILVAIVLAVGLVYAAILSIMR